MLATPIPLSAKSEVFSTESPEKCISGPSARQHIERALRKVHEMLPATASQAAFHREMMAMLSTVEWPQLQPNKDVGVVAHKSTNKTSVREPAHTAVSSRPEPRMKKRREFSVFRKDIRMGVRGNAPVNKLRPQQNITRSESNIRPTAALVSTIQQPEGAETTTEAARERKALAALQAATHNAAIAASKSTIVEFVPEYVNSALKHGSQNPRAAKKYAIARKPSAEEKVPASATRTKMLMGSLSNASQQSCQRRRGGGYKRSRDDDADPANKVAKT